MIEIIVNILVLVGCGFVCLAAIGVLRFPDFYTRLHAATKAGAFGGAILAIACGIAIGGINTWLQSIAVILFFYITTPIASHLLGRAAYLRKVHFYNPKKS